MEDESSRESTADDPLAEEREDTIDDFENGKFGTRRITGEMLEKFKELRNSGELWDLPDMAYQVTKINQYGKRQQRTLRLSREGVENVRKNGKVSSVYPYEQIQKVHMKNLKTFIIKYDTGKHDYQYRSPVAMHIVQEITSRLSLKKRGFKPMEVKSDIARKHQEKLQQSGVFDELHKTSTPRQSIITSAGPNEEERKSQQAKKLKNLLGVTEEQRLDTAITEILLDPSATEGQTLKQFCNNFGVLEKNPATLVMNVRQFIDDLRAYILEKHDAELSKLLVEASSKSFTPEELSLTSIIEYNLEKMLVRRFKPRIVACLKQPSKEQEMMLKRNIVRAKEKPQTFFGVKTEYVSESNWAAPIGELRAINEVDLPSKQLAAILAAAKSIYSTFNYEQNKGKRAEQRKAHFLSADDFFPIFIYVLVHSDVDAPQILSEFLWNLCDPEQLNGEGGYYLTVFCSALEYLKSLFQEEEGVLVDKCVDTNDDGARDKDGHGGGGNNDNNDKGGAGGSDGAAGGGSAGNRQGARSLSPRSNSPTSPTSTSTSAKSSSLGRSPLSSSSSSSSLSTSTASSMTSPPSSWNSTTPLSPSDVSYALVQAEGSFGEDPSSSAAELSNGDSPTSASGPVKTKRMYIEFARSNSMHVLKTITRKTSGATKKVVSHRKSTNEGPTVATTPDSAVDPKKPKRSFSLHFNRKKRGGKKKKGDSMKDAITHFDLECDDVIIIDDDDDDDDEIDDDDDDGEEEEEEDNEADDEGDHDRGQAGAAAKAENEDESGELEADKDAEIERQQQSQTEQQQLTQTQQQQQQQLERSTSQTGANVTTNGTEGAQLDSGGAAKVEEVKWIRSSYEGLGATARRAGERKRTAVLQGEK